MKKPLLILVLVAAAGYFGWKWFAPSPSPPPPVVRPQVQRTSVKPAAAGRTSPANRPAAQKSGAPARPAVATRPPRLAPEGTFFLRQRVSLKLDSGIIGFAPGTKVSLVEKGDPLSTFTDGKYQFMIPPSLLTNDLNIAEDAAKSDYAAQAQAAAFVDQSVRLYEQRQREAIAAAEKEKAQKKTGKKTPPHR